MILGEPKSAREWWYLVAIITLCEFIFLHVIYTKGYDLDAQRAWEFGHVLVAIVLAIIAIVYSLYQGITQESNTQKLAAQIDSLNGVLKSVSNSATTLDSGMEDLKRLTAQFDKVVGGVLGQEKSLAEISSKIDKLAEPKSAPPAAPRHGADSFDKALLKSWLRAFSTLSTDCAYVFFRYDGRKYDFSHLVTIFKDTGSKDKIYAESDRAYFSGVLSTTRSMLSSMGLVSLKADESSLLSVSQPLKDALAEYFANPDPKALGYPTTHVEAFNALKNAIDKDLGPRG